MRALVFCLLAGFLFNRDPGFGDLRLCPMVWQMEDMGCIDGVVLTETIRSLDRAALGFDDWIVSPIILQVFFLLSYLILLLLFNLFLRNRKDLLLRFG